MAKRFTDTEIWEQDWYVSLPSKYKLFYSYIKDKCDDSGVWRPNKEIIQRIIGEPINFNEFLVFINTEEKTRVLVLENGRWFIKDYFFFQYGDKFNPHSPVHRGVLKRLLIHGVHIKELNKVFCGKLIDADIQELRQIAYDYPIDTLLITYGYPINRVKDKDKEKENKKGGMGENKNLEKAVKFSENGEFAIFQDGSQQKLGKSQKVRLMHDDLKPEDVFKGVAV